MDKNTIWAMVLCAIVMVATLVVETVYVVPKQQAAQEQQMLEQQAAEEERQALTESQQEMISSGLSESEKSEVSSVEEEQFYTIKTDKVEVKFTNKGGDVVSYKLLEHFDRDSNDSVEMVDNVTDYNRAFALNFGDSNGSILNETFNVKTNVDGDPYKIGFYRNYNVKDSLGNEHKITLGKLYTFTKDDYVFKLDITTNAGNSSEGLNLGGYAYTLRTSPQIGPHYDRKNRYEVRQYLSLDGSKRIRKNIATKTYNRRYDWAGVAGKYFTILVKPVNTEDMAPVTYTSTAVVNDYSDAQLFLTRNAIPQGSITDSYYVYVGPRSEGELIKYNSSDKNGWGLVNAKFNQALQTSGFLYFIEIAIKWCLQMLYKLVHNWGICIIILTILLKIVLFPLNKKTSLGSLKMQEIQPKMQALQEKYKNDQQKLSEESAKLYKEAGYNPATGCLPMVLQMIILFAMYNVFNNQFEFRGASFIPGWIDDLSVGDRVLSWDKEIPVISAFCQNTLRLLPIIYTASQIFNGLITQYGGAGAGNAQTQGTMKFMTYGMPILFFFMFYNVPSGLLLYWTVSNILQIGQQLVINSIMKKKRAEMAKNAPVVNKNVIKFKGGKKKTR